MIPGREYIVEYGSTQHGQSRGSKPRHVTVKSQGDSSQMDFYGLGRPINKGVWVIDHNDNDVEKFFFHSRFMSIQTELSIDDLI